MGGRTITEEKTPACTFCGQPAIYLDRQTDRLLCADHFTDAFEGRVRETIIREEMISAGDLVAVALSGGKDSSVLLFLLHRQCRDIKADIVAITIDEGIPGYRDETISAARELTETLGITHRVLSFPDAYGDTLGGLLEGREERSCSVCGVLRRQLLQTAADNLGASVLATGHCLDDEVQAMMMNYLRGDLGRIARDASTGPGSGMVRRVKPLKSVTEKEVALYGMIRCIWRELPECPYAGNALRSDVRSLVGKLERESPGAMRRIAEGYKVVQTAARLKPAPPFSRCASCGAPCSGDLCRTCAILKDFHSA